MKKQQEVKSLVKEAKLLAAVILSLLKARGRLNLLMSSKSKLEKFQVGKLFLV